jgi:[ribosomal protein S18]-alanine N-acetyltransferase
MENVEVREMEFTLRYRTEEDTKEFLTWTYEGIYSFYDNNIQQEKIDGIKNAQNSKRAFSVVNQAGDLVGNCEFFDVEEEDGEKVLAVGVQMKPTFTGQGHGAIFCHAIVEEGRKLLGYNHLELMVADFNKRAIRTYQKIGFTEKESFENEIRGNTYQFIVMEKDWDTND